MKVQLDKSKDDIDQEKIAHRFSRRSFIKYSIGSIVMTYSGWGFAGKKGIFTTYKIDSEVRTTVERMLSFAIPEKVKSPVIFKLELFGMLT